MEPFRFDENTRFLKTFPQQISGDPDYIRNQALTNTFAVLEDISRSLATITDLMILEDNRRRKESNKEETEKLIKSMDSINKAREDSKE